MKCKNFLSLILCLCLTGITMAQTPAQDTETCSNCDKGAGTAKFIAMFSGTHELKDST
jgi:hypothetical protein